MVRTIVISVLRLGICLQYKGIDYVEIPADKNSELRSELEQKSGQKGLPKNLIGDHSVGGFTDF